MMKLKIQAAFITEEINRFLREFQGIEIAVPTGASTTTQVRVHVPYMMQTVRILEDEAAFAKLATQHQARLLRVKHARDHAREAIKTFFQQHFYTAEGQELGVACGRGDLEAIQQVTQAAVRQGLVPAREGKRHPDGYAVRQWLKTYGLGIDCSAFVQHALTRVVRRYRAALGSTVDEAAPYQVGWLLSRPVYQNIAGVGEGDARFALVVTPGDARPGDILVRVGHVRIVTHVAHLQASGVMLHLAESASSKGTPVGQAAVDTDIGPRRLPIQYPRPELAIGEQVPLRKRFGNREFTEDAEERVYILGRLKVLK